MKLGERIKKTRRYKGLSQSQLARAAGISNDYMSRIELGKVSNVGIEVIESLAKALEVSPSSLLYDIKADAGAIPEPIPERIPAALKALHEWLDSLPDDEREIVDGILKSLPDLKKPDIALLGQMVAPLKKLREKKRRAGAGK